MIPYSGLRGNRWSKVTETILPSVKESIHDTQWLVGVVALDLYNMKNLNQSRKNFNMPIFISCYTTSTTTSGTLNYFMRTKYNKYNCRVKTSLFQLLGWSIFPGDVSNSCPHAALYWNSFMLYYVWFPIHNTAPIEKFSTSFPLQHYITTNSIFTKQ